MFLRVPFLYGIKYGFWLHVLAYAIKYIDDDELILLGFGVDLA